MYYNLIGSSRPGNYLVMNSGIEEVKQESSWKQQNLILLENTIHDFHTAADGHGDIHAVNEKQVSIGNGYGKMTFHLSRYEKGQWVSANNVPYYFGDNDGNPISDLQFTGADGMITYVSDGVNNMNLYFDEIVFIEDIARSRMSYSTYWYPERVDYDCHFYDEYGRSLYGPSAYGVSWTSCLLIDEVPELIDAVCGTLKGYPRQGQELSFYRDYTYYYSADLYRTFLYTDVSSVIEVGMEVNIPTTKSFTLQFEQHDSILNGVGNILPGANLSYVVYDQETGEEISRGTTNGAGELSLQGGQYARVSVPSLSKWKITELDPYPYKLVYIGGSYRYYTSGSYDTNGSYVLREWTIGSGFYKGYTWYTQTESDVRNYAYVRVY